GICWAIITGTLTSRGSLPSSVIRACGPPVELPITSACGLADGEAWRNCTIGDDLAAGLAGAAAGTVAAVGARDARLPRPMTFSISSRRKSLLVLMPAVDGFGM